MADQGAVEQVDVPVDVHMTELPQPESPPLIDWQRFGPADNEEVETKKERAARIAVDNCLEELMWEDVEIADTLVTYDRPLVTAAERRLLASQPVDVLPEDSSTAANIARANRENQLSNFQDVANMTTPNTITLFRHISLSKSVRNLSSY